MQRPIRVLHLINCLRHGGLETWLMEMVRVRNRDDIEIDVCTINPRLAAGEYEDEFRQLGGRIFRCPLRKNLWSFNRDLRNILKEGKYDILHSHHYYASGYFLKVAHTVRGLALVAHLHPTVDFNIGIRVPFPRSFFRWLMKRWIDCYADAILGASHATLELNWGANWHQDSRKFYQPNGINLAQFKQPINSIQVRQELDLPADARIVLTVGRHVPHKRHIIIPEIAKDICGKYDNVYFVINGDGPLYEELDRRINELGLHDRFRLTRGFPSLVPLWKSGDVFLFPSAQEGFGIVVIEAAAAGLPIVARRIPGVMEAAQASDKAILLDPDSPVGLWIEAVEKALLMGRTQISDYDLFEKDFKYTTQASWDNLVHIYKTIGAQKRKENHRSS